MFPYVRTVKTASGATAVQIVHSSRRGRRLVAGQEELDLGLERTKVPRRGAGGGLLPITSSRMGHLWDALAHAYDELGFGPAAGGYEVFRQLVLARIIEPASKLDSLRVLEETGVSASSYRTVLRRLPVYAKASWRQQLAAACAGAHGPGTGEPGALRRVHAVFRD